MIFETLLADLGVVLLIEPFYYSVFDFADSLQVSEVLLEFVSIRRHVLDSVVIANIFLIGELVKDKWMPID